MFLDRTREMVSFEVGKEIEKDVYCLVTSVGQRKKFESPWGIERFVYLLLRCFQSGHAQKSIKSQLSEFENAIKPLTMSL